MTHNSRTPVLLTVPCTVIASPTPTAPAPWKAFSLSAGFEDRKGLGMAFSLCLYESTQYRVPLSLLLTPDGNQFRPVRTLAANGTSMDASMNVRESSLRRRR